MKSFPNMSPTLFITQEKFSSLLWSSYFLFMPQNTIMYVLHALEGQLIRCNSFKLCGFIYML